MTKGILAATAAVVLSQFAGSAQAGVLWDNGGPAVSNVGGSGMSDTIQAEDFQLFGSNILSSITFWNLQSAPADYLGSINWQILKDAGGSPGALVDFGTATPTRTAAGTMLGLDVFQNSFNLSTLLLGGNYWLTLHNGPVSSTGFTDFYWTWTDLNGTNTGTNRGQELGLDPPASGYTTNDQEHAFVVSGDNVPEPGTIAFAFLGIASFTVRRWYKR
ncbi:MAG: sorting protein [Candidatus Solibacter sp.]|nr:sorting protein [Candidatus Solibacter sp.]